MDLRDAGTEVTRILDTITDCWVGEGDRQYCLEQVETDLRRLRTRIFDADAGL